MYIKPQVKVYKFQLRESVLQTSSVKVDLDEPPVDDPSAKESVQLKWGWL